MWTLQGYARNGSMRDYVLVPSEIIDKDAYIQNCHELIDEKNKELAASRKREEILRNALKILYEETADYIRINHLGDVHHNQSMKLAKESLGEEKSI